jgi:integrase
MPGEGSVYRSGRWWIAQLSTGGRETRRYERRKRLTQREAAVALAEMQADRRAGVSRSRQTTGDYLVGWVADVRNIRPATRHGYATAIELHLLPTVGPIRLADLTPLDVEHALSGLAERMSPKHLRNVHAVLRKALSDARRMGLVARNVASREYIDAPRVPDREPEAFSEREIARLLTAARGEWLEPALRLSIGTGIRQGELLGLAWEDIDYDGARLHVRRALRRIIGPTRREGQYVRDELKTGSRSRRVLPLALALLDALRAQEAQVRAVGFVPITTGPVFVTRPGRADRPGGEPLHSAVLTHWLYEIEQRAGVRRLAWKNLRTTFGSRLFEAGVPDRTIADWLGHRRTTTTHGHYIDTANGDQVRALAAVGALLG